MLLSSARKLLEEHGFRVTVVWRTANTGDLVATHSDNTPHLMPIGNGTVNSDNVNELVQAEHERRAAIAEKLEAQSSIDRSKGA